jgi:hypothetical protein
VLLPKNLKLGESWEDNGLGVAARIYNGKYFTRLPAEENRIGPTGKITIGMAHDRRKVGAQDGWEIP